MNAVNVSAANAKVFSPVGFCIYCGGGKLTKEHVFPKGLGGGLILPRASCASCQTEIHSFETICMRQTLLPYRKNTGLVRHLNDLPARVPLTLDLELQGPTQVALHSHPNVVVLPGFRDLPGILTDHSPQPVIEFEHKIFCGLEILAEMKLKLQGRKIGINLAWIMQPRWRMWLK